MAKDNHPEEEFRGLLRMLECERTDYKTLLEYSLRKREVLLSHDIEGLASITQDEERIIQGIHEIEDERQGLLDGLMGEFQIPSDELRLSRLAKLVKPEASDRFMAIGEELKVLLEELSCENRINSKLILDSLAFTTCILDVITQQDREKSTYKEKGQRERKGFPLVVDRRA